MTTNKWNKADVDIYTQTNDVKSFIYPKLINLIYDCKSVADYGCGDGYFLNELKANDKRLYGFDVSKDMINKASSLLGENATLEVIKSGEIPLHDNSLDHVVSNLALMMVQKLEMLNHIYSNIYRVLKPGGYFTFCITHPAFIDKNFKHYKNNFFLGYDYIENERPYQFILKKENGIEITNENFIDYHYPISTFLNLLAKNGFIFNHIEEILIPGEQFPSYLIIQGKK